MQAHSIPLLSEADVKVFYDGKGKKREVLMSYKRFQEILAFIESVAYFDSEPVQERLRQSEEDLRAGRYIRVKPGDVDKALEWLNE